MFNAPELPHDRLAVRLSVIITRLVAGDLLNLRSLADEFGVSERTLRRDFHQRLGHLDIVHENGHYRLEGELQADNSPATLSFIQNTGIAHIIPDKEHALLMLLTRDCPNSPCLIWHPPLKPHAGLSEFFTRLAEAITEQTQISVLVKGQRHDALEPYRLIHFGEEWYLVVCQCGELRVFTLSTITAVTLCGKRFTRNEDISYLTAGEGFIAALPHFPLISDIINTFRK